ncbi:MAG: hypothetical protein DI529_06710, partial [Chryseobacterium sp.]
TNQTIYLKDNVLNTIINLSEQGSYKFAATRGTDNTRFEIIYQDSSSIQSANRASGSVNVMKDETELIIIDTKDIITSVDVFDVSGKLVKSLSGNNSKEIRLSTLGLLKGVYVLKITSVKGIISKKVIL